jgi:hypothetical protein
MLAIPSFDGLVAEKEEKQMATREKQIMSEFRERQEEAEMTDGDLSSDLMELRTEALKDALSIQERFKGFMIRRTQDSSGTEEEYERVLGVKKPIEMDIVFELSHEEKDMFLTLDKLLNTVPRKSSRKDISFLDYQMANMIQNFGNVGLAVHQRHADRVTGILYTTAAKYTQCSTDFSINGSR